MTAVLEVAGLCKSFGGLQVTRSVDMQVARGERHLVIGPNGAGKTTLFNLIAGDMPADRGSIRLDGREVTRESTAARAQRGVARTYQIVTLFGRDNLLHNVKLALLGKSSQALAPVGQLRRRPRPVRARARGAGRGGAGGEGAAAAGTDLVRREAPPGNRHGAGAVARVCCCSTSRSRACRRPSARPSPTLLAGISRDITIVMIEHDMQAALAFADRITLLHYGEVITAGTRQQVVDDPRTQQIYLGH